MADDPNSAQGEPKPWGMPPKRRGMSLGCQIILGICAVLALIVIVLVISGYNAVQWMQQGAEATPASYPKVELTAAEEIELQGLLVTLDRAQRNGNTFDATFAPKLLNEFVRRELQKQKDAGTNEIEGFEITSVGDGIRVRLTVKDKGSSQYVNLDITGDLSLDDRKFDGRVDSVKLAGREAPWLVMWFVRTWISAAKGGNFKIENDPQAQKKLDEFLAKHKLLKREGDKFHVILDGARLKEDFVERTSGSGDSSDSGAGAGAQPLSE